MKAEERGQELLESPYNQMPPAALEYTKYMCHKVGICTETMLSALTAYAQCVEGLECTDPLYKASDEDKEWFNEYRHTGGTSSGAG